MEPDPDIAVAVSTSKQLSLLASFVAVVQSGSFTRAARKTGVDKSALSRRVRALEDELAVQLLHRTTRKIRVTAAGRQLVERVQDPLGQLALALAEANGAQPIAGVVRVASLTLLSALWVSVAAALRRDHPALRLHLSNHDTLVSLVDEGFDLAVRAGHLPDSGLVARRLATWRYLLVASPSWVAEHRPRSLSDIADHWLLYGDVPRADRWRFERGDAGMELQVKPVLVANDSVVLHDAAVAGLGVTAVPPFQASALLASGALVRVLPDWRVAHEIPIWGVVPHRSHVPARVQTVLAAISAALRRHEPSWRALTE